MEAGGGRLRRTERRTTNAGKGAGGGERVEFLGREVGGGRVQVEAHRWQGIIDLRGVP
jgi:hypothetical protein